MNLIGWCYQIDGLIGQSQHTGGVAEPTSVFIDPSETLCCSTVSYGKISALNT